MKAWKVYKVLNTEQVKFLRAHPNPVHVRPDGLAHQLIYYDESNPLGGAQPNLSQQLKRAEVADYNAEPTVPLESDELALTERRKDAQEEPASEEETSEEEEETEEKEVSEEKSDEEIETLLIHRGGGYYDLLESEESGEVATEHLGKGKEEAIKQAREILSG